MQGHTALVCLLSFIIQAVLTFSPVLLTNKIVIIENITLSCVAAFKWNSESPFAERGRAHAQRITSSERRACVCVYTICVGLIAPIKHHRYTRLQMETCSMLL